MRLCVATIDAFSRMYVYVTGIAVACLGLSLLYSTCLSYLLFVLLTIGLVLSSVAVVVWVHIKLSSRHVATVGAEHTLKDIENFRISLMVSRLVRNTTSVSFLLFSASMRQASR